jgi:AcrR family transcriptional regulator
MRENEQTKDKLIASALKIFTEKGFHQTKVSDIVKDAGFSQGTFYLYFMNKEVLFHSIIEDYMGTMGDVVEHSCAEECELWDEQQIYDFLYAMVSNILTIFCSNKAIIEMMKLYGMNFPEVQETSRTFKSRMVRVILDHMQRNEGDSFFNQEQMEVFAYASVGMIEEVAFQWFIERNEGLESVDKIAHVLAGIQVKHWIAFKAKSI